MTNGQKTRCKKKEKLKILEVLELLNDKQIRKQRSDEIEDVKTQKCFVSDKKLKLETKQLNLHLKLTRKHLVEF